MNEIPQLQNQIANFFLTPGLNIIVIILILYIVPFLIFRSLDKRERKTVRFSSNNGTIFLGGLLIIPIFFFVLSPYFFDFPNGEELGRLPYVYIIYSLIYIVGYFLLLYLHFKRVRKKNEYLRINTPIPLHELPKDLKIYEVGTLLDGQMHLEDIIATLVHSRLQKGEDRDPIERQIDSVAHSSLVMTLNQLLTKNDNKYGGKNINLFANPVYDKLVSDNYFRYNPTKVQGIAVVTPLVLFSIWGLLGFPLSAFIYGSYWLALLMITLSVLVAVFSFSFHENLEKTLPVQRDLLGFRMFLETADRFRLKHDEKYYREAIALFISLRISDVDLRKIAQYVDDYVHGPKKSILEKTLNDFFKFFK